jgi:hypothetical protein
MNKILNIIIYDERLGYERLIKAQLERLSKNNHNIIQYFCTFNEKIDSPIKLVDNVIYIKGSETYLPGILDKTIKAIQYCVYTLGIKFDYLIRSNISTVIDFKNIPYSELVSDDIVYTTSYIVTLHAIDPPCGIYDDSLFGTPYASGTNIILNTKGVYYLLNNIDKINMTIIDDLAIGLVMKEVTTVYKLSTELIFNNCDKIGVFYRCKSAKKQKNRHVDIPKIEKIITRLLN